MRVLHQQNKGLSGARTVSYTQLDVYKRQDIPLCDEGRAQLNELKERFEYPQVDTVFSSPLLRAVETANIRFSDA